MANTIDRKEMERAIAEGGSVLYAGRIITKKEDLPSEAELSKGDADREAAARAALLAQRQAIDTQLAGLTVAEPEKTDSGKKDGK